MSCSNLGSNWFANLGEFLSHHIDGLLVSFNSAGLLEDGRSGNHHVNSGFGNLSDVVNLDTSINFQTAVQSVVVDQFSGFSGLVKGGRDEGLSSESRVDRHEKDDVKLVQDVLGGIKRGTRVENKSGLASSVLDQLKGSVDVVGGLRVEGDVRGSGIDEGLDGLIDRGNHKMDIDRGGNAVVTKGLADHRSDGQVRDVVVVHNIEVNDIGSGLQDVVNFGTEAGEISGKDGRSDQVVLVSPNVQGGGRTGGLLRLKFCRRKQSEKIANRYFPEILSPFSSFRTYCGEGTGRGKGGGNGEKAELHLDRLFCFDVMIDNCD